MRRNFFLPEEDADHLDSLGLPWEAATIGGVNWVLIHDFPVPLGYTRGKVVVAIRIEAMYPAGMLDMAYFFPPLARADGKPINALTPHELDGKTFQQWSRHYTWVAGEHSLITHLGCVQHWLSSELSKR